MKVVTLYCIILLFAVGCRKSKGSSQDSAAIFPDKIGDSWTYLVNDTLYSYNNPDVIRQYNMTVSVVGSTLLPGGIRANVWVYNTPSGADTNYVYHNGDIISFLSVKSAYPGFIKNYIFPLQLNNSWQYTFNSIHEVTVDSLADLIVGPNHFDHAFHISGYPGRPDEMFQLEEWIKNNVGIVKRYFNNLHFTTYPFQHRTSWSLVSYHIE